MPWRRAPPRFLKCNEAGEQKKIPTSEEAGICFRASTRVFKPSREGSHRRDGVGVNESQAGLLTCSEGGLSILPHGEWIGARW
jgi:hypothetical protein